MGTDEWEWLQQYLLSGSQEAFAALVGRYVDLVYNACRRQLRDPHLAEDITQSVFLVLARRAGQLKQDVILSGWLFQVARYGCANAIRIQFRRRRHEEAAAAIGRWNMPADQSDEPAPAMAVAEMKPLLDEAVNRLKSTDRDAVLMRFFEGRSVKEIAAALRISENTASQKLSRAVIKLRPSSNERA